jgi:hypothetical protein
VIGTKPLCPQAALAAARDERKDAFCVRLTDPTSAHRRCDGYGPTPRRHRLAPPARYCSTPMVETAQTVP